MAHLPAYVASAVSLVYTSPHALSDTHSVLDEAEKQRDSIQDSHKILSGLIINKLGISLQSFHWLELTV